MPRKLAFGVPILPKVTPLKPLKSAPNGNRKNWNAATGKYRKTTTKAQKRKAKEMQDPSRGFEKYEERLNGPDSMLKDHTAARYKSNKTVTRVITSVRDDVQPHGAINVNYILVKVMHNILTRLGDTEEVKIKRYEKPPETIYKLEGGLRYCTKFEIDHGKPNKYMKASMNNFSTSRVTLPQLSASTSLVETIATRAFSQTGANRQGVMTDFLLNPTKDYLDSTSSSEVYRYFGLPSEGMMADYFAREGCTQEVRAFLASLGSQKDRNINLYTNIVSRWSKHSFWNSNKFSEANIKVYVCQARKLVHDRNIWNDVCAFGNTTSTLQLNRIPEDGVTDSTVPLNGSGKNWFTPAAEIPITIPSLSDPTGVPLVVDRYAEFSTVLGVTPQQSMTFNDNWDVLDVIDCTISPQDTWELDLEEKFSKAHNVKQWISVMGFATNASSAGYKPSYKATHMGDIVLYVTFNGNPASTYNIPFQEPTSGVIPQRNTIPVQASPCRIRHQVLHGLKVSWPKTLVGTLPTSAPPEQFAKEGWSIPKERQNNTNRESYPFGIGEILIMSSEDEKEGGLKSNFKD